MALDKLKKLAAAPKNLRWYMPCWAGAGDVPYVDIDYASTDNPKWMQARIAYEASSEGKKIARMKDGNPRKFEDQRDADYPLFAKVLVTGWGNIPGDEEDAKTYGVTLIEVTDEKTKVVSKFLPFVPGNFKMIEDVLRSFGNTNFDSLRVDARSPEKQTDARELGGN